MYSAIRATENALNEPHVGVYERQPQGLTGLGVGLRHHSADVGQTDKGVEIVDGYWLASIGSIAFGPNTWNEPPRAGEPPGIGTGANDALVSTRAGLNKPEPSAPPSAAVPAAARPNCRRVILAAGRRTSPLP
jgi:hypothetical protein